MKKLQYTASFNTPAFLGNAEQQAQWRVPPFKALLRQWWRVVKAPAVDYDYKKLLKQENSLFGCAGLHGEDASKSKVKLRLDSWRSGKLSQWNSANNKVYHPEVGNGGRQIDPDLYLGYGPLGFDRNSRSTQLSILDKKDPKSLKYTAISPSTDKVKLTVMYPDEYALEIAAAMNLIAWFGTLGSRSRNGWGSLQLEGLGETRIATLNPDILGRFSHPLDDSLNRHDWPHAIGRDAKGLLIWHTDSTQDWREIIKKLAELKILFRTQLPFNSGNYAPTIEKRHLLAYPVTNHFTRVWGGQKRLANQLRFKVIKHEAGVRGQIIHLPCRLPDELSRNAGEIPDELATWQEVHRVLDGQVKRSIQE